ncbi:response regulator [Acidithiobacillus sp.]|uniref:response regulator n=1 Tax=Acidithiobacillus sp. TaxID=1872118 RepID=UPI0026371918|nr:response regulator [Acidithiobacillus sp.]
MTKNPSNSDSILVRSIGMDARKEAVFRMAFKMFTRRRYQLLDTGDTQAPAVTIIDVDGAEGMAIAHQLHSEQPEQRILLTSVSPQADSVFPVLQKPVRMETLFPALESLLNGGPAPGKPAGRSGATVMPIRPEVTIPAPATPVVPSPAAANPSAPKPVAAPRLTPVLRPEEIRHFNPQAGLLGLLQIIRRDQSSAIIVDGQQQIILRLDPMADQAILLADDEHLKSLAREEHPQLQMRAPNHADVPAHASTRRLTLQSLLWQMGAWTADGRLSQQLQINAPVQLKQWPNLTRLTMLPDALRLAAFLARSPASPALTVKMLRVEPHDLFNFLAAADSLGLLRYNTAENPDNRIQPTTSNASTPAEIPAAKRSFLGRLLARISGL